MEKLELKHLAPYLPYNLKLRDIDNIYKEDRILTIESMRWLISNGKPILRPLSDLTKEIDVNGEKFVPYDKIKELYSNTPQFTEYKENWIDMYGIMNSKCEYVCVQKLFEWHFDVFNLHSKGLCIYYNELSK